MIHTFKIEIFICEPDKNLKTEYYKKLYDLRYSARKSANVTSSHLFALNTLMPYMSDEDKENLVFIGTKGTTATRGNAPYVALSKEFKGKSDMGMISSVIQNATKNYSSDVKEMIIGKRSLRSYRNNIPIPFKPDRFVNFRESEYIDGEGKTKNGIFFAIAGIPFQMRFGRDLSGTGKVVEKVLCDEFKMVTSSIVIDDNRKKTFLLLCADIPKKKTELIEGKKLFVSLGVMQPAVVGLSVFDCTLEDARKEYKVFSVGSADEFNHKRRGISESIKRLQKAAKYNEGGKGRKRKLQLLDTLKDKERKYVEGKAHVYSKEIVALAVKNQCSEIVLINQQAREEKAKNAGMMTDSECNENEKIQKFIFRNWSWYGLTDKIKYKAEMYGISVTKT